MAYRVYALTDGFVAGDELPMVRSISVNRTAEGDECLLESASMEVDGSVFRDGWYRIYAEGAGRSSLGSFYFQAKSSKFAHGVRTWSCEGYSALYPSSVDTAPAGGCARTGADAVEAVKALLSPCSGKVTADGAHYMMRNVVFDATKSRLAAAWLILDACNMGMRLDGDGNIELFSVPTSDKFCITAAEPHGAKMDGISYGESISFERDGSDMDLRPFDRISVMGNSAYVTTQSLNLGAYISESNELKEAPRG